MHAKGDKGHQCLGGTQKHESITPRPLASVQEQADEAEVPAASECHDGSQKKKRDDMSLGLQDLTDEEDNAETQSSVITQDDFPPRMSGHILQGQGPIQNHGHNFETVQLGAQICTMIKREHRKYEQLKIAVKKATLLITDDYSPTTVVKAHKIMVASSNAGSLIHPANDDDTELEEIFHRNIVTFRLKVKLLVTDNDSNQAANKLHSEQAKVQQHAPNASIGQTARLVTSCHCAFTSLGAAESIFEECLKEHKKLRPPEKTKRGASTQSMPTWQREMTRAIQEMEQFSDAEAADENDGTAIGGEDEIGDDTVEEY
ncbi:hypothetical protein F5J12DRAFT_929996 [Pisolithus orientalis]|uniref:uncharacterized protein n=1 Tax=Pisolithus orientalis TaxID=936130 RepID=UPI0022240683|nr:uncharacterized protein F5J12DRAFT_929996 [Pisolithus orientalis]KAI5989189.1 hypothetical protein F5J12DRAFT_929996 [Pisolithus orientalis]